MYKLLSIDFCQYHVFKITQIYIERLFNLKSMVRGALGFTVLRYFRNF